MRYVVEALFLRELKTRFGKNRRLGYFWVVGEPMTHILFFLVIFTLIRARTIPQVPIEMFLVTGFVPFFMFRNIVTQIMAGVQANRALIAYKPVKPIHIFIARTLLEMCIYFAVFVLFITSVAVVFVWLEKRVDQKPTFECLQKQKKGRRAKSPSPRKSEKGWR